MECAPISTAMPEMQMHVTVLQCSLVPARVVLCIAVTGHSQKPYISIRTETEETLFYLYEKQTFVFKQVSGP